jgi:hypothetical protein
MTFPYLDLAIAMCFIFLLLALICTTINETIAGVINSRGKTLEKGVAVKDKGCFFDDLRSTFDGVARSILGWTAVMPIQAR